MMSSSNGRRSTYTKRFWRALWRHPTRRRLPLPSWTGTNRKCRRVARNCWEISGSPECHLGVRICDWEHFSFWLQRSFLLWCIQRRRASFIRCKIPKKLRLERCSKQTPKGADQHPSRLPQIGHGGGSKELQRETDVVDTCHPARISKKCIQLKLIGVIRGWMRLWLNRFCYLFTVL